MSTTEITAKVRRMKKLQSKVQELEIEIKAIQGEIKAVMEQQDTQEMKAGIFTIRFKEVISNRFDSSAFKKTHADLYNQYLKQTITRRFSVA